MFTATRSVQAKHVLYPRNHVHTACHLGVETINKAAVMHLWLGHCLCCGCRCRKVSLQQLPPILYQVLLLSSCGARQFALTGLKRLFAHLEQQPANQAPSNPAAATSAAAGTGGSMPCATLLQVEATLLMHISTLLKYDAALGSEWLKWFRSHGVEGDSSFILQVGTQFMVRIEHGKMPAAVDSPLQLHSSRQSTSLPVDLVQDGCCGGQ